ncbi:MAG: hypothetical protein HY909_24675 [Deltaproteobacteria bacterium]|nr:hypothetical protein [Deltaproteobacteria bacterium]
MPRRLLLSLGACLALGAAPRGASAQPAPPSPRLTALDPADLAALRPLALRGAAALVKVLEPADARAVVAMAVHAPLGVVHDVLVDGASWPQYIPAINTSQLLSRHGNRAAYRFTTTGALLDLSATCTLTDVSPTRVDVGVTQSEFGPAGARWDLYREGPSETLVVLTTWAEPNRGHWLLRQAAVNPTYTIGMGVAVDLSLVQSAARRASTLAGHPVPVRPANNSPPPGELRPPPHGPWWTLVSHWYVLAFELSPEGAVQQVTGIAQTNVPPDQVIAHVSDLGRYHALLPPFHAEGITPGPQPDTLQATVRLDGSWDHAEGTVLRRSLGPTAVLLEGTSGELTGTRWRWDTYQNPDQTTLLCLTGGVEPEVASFFGRVAIAREPFLLGGLAALRRLVWVRYLLPR